MPDRDLTRTKPPRWCRPMTRTHERLSGASMGEEFDGHVMAVDAWGERADADNSCFPAFAYLWRRFGPPFMGCDDHKKLCRYVIRTPMAGVYLSLSIKGMPITFGVSYMATDAVRESFGGEIRAWFERACEWAAAHGYTDGNAFWIGKKSHEDRKRCMAEIGPRPYHDPKEWRTMPGPEGEMNRAIHSTLRELCRPVYIRDVAIDLFGVTKAHWKHAAKPSKYAGYGVPVEAMNNLCKAG